LCINLGGLTTNSLLSRDWKNSEKNTPKKYSKLMKKCPMSHPLCANCWPLKKKHDDKKMLQISCVLTEKKRKYYHRWEKWTLISIAVKCEIKENLLKFIQFFSFPLLLLKKWKKNWSDIRNHILFSEKKN